MTHESITGSDVVADDSPTTDPSAVTEDRAVEEDLSNHPIYSSQPNLLETIIGFFIRTPARQERERSRRLRELNVSIEYSPDSPTLYVLRGELFLERKEYHLAKADFETAIEIADEFDPEMGWGFVAQAMRDRASDGLEKVQRRLQ